MLYGKVPCFISMLCFYALFQAEKHNLCLVQSLIPRLNAGAVVFKPLDSSQMWAHLDQDARDILESLLHDKAKRRLTATQLLHNPWVYEAQGKPFPPDTTISALPRSRVPSDIVCIVPRERRRQHLPANEETSGDHMAAQPQWPEYHMLDQPGQPRPAQHGSQALARRLHPYSAAVSSDLATWVPSAAATAGPYYPSSARDRPPFAAATAAAPHSLYTAVPRPMPLNDIDVSNYPYSVVPRARPHATAAAQSLEEAAPCFHHGASAHGLYAAVDPASLAESTRLPILQISVLGAHAYRSAHMPKTHQCANKAGQFALTAGSGSLKYSESLLDFQSTLASESLTGSASQSGSESLRLVSDYSSFGHDSSSESVSASEESRIISDADSPNSPSVDSEMDSDTDSDHGVSSASETASVAESGGRRWRQVNQIEEDAGGIVGVSLSPVPDPIHGQGLCGTSAPLLK